MRQWIELTQEEQQAVTAALAYPFPPDEIDWLPMATYEKDGQNFAKGAAYADLRSYQERLDTVCGQNWTVRYRALPVPTKGNVGVICSLTIYGRTVEDVGEAEQTDQNAWTSAMAQAFKRAASAVHRVGRYLYDQDSPWVPYDKQRKQITKEGLSTLNKHYFAWYVRTTGQRTVRERQAEPTTTTTTSAPTPPPQPPPPPPPQPPLMITDDTKRRIYAEAQAIFGETDWIDALAWYTAAFAKTPLAVTKTLSPDQFQETEAQTFLAAMIKNTQVLPEYWASAKATILAARAGQTPPLPPQQQQQPALRPN